MIDKEEYTMPHMCPVCGKYEFPAHGSYEVCEECGWEDDAIQEEEPNEGGANPETLAGYRALYEAGKHRKPLSEKLRWLREQGFFKDNKTE